MEREIAIHIVRNIKQLTHLDAMNITLNVINDIEEISNVMNRKKRDFQDTARAKCDDIKSDSDKLWKDIKAIRNKYVLSTITSKESTEKRYTCKTT